MKKSKINLLINREDYKKYEVLFSWLRIVTVIIVCLFIIVSLFFFFVNADQTKQLDSLLSQKQSLLQSLKNRQVDVAKLSYVESKYQSLSEYLKDDAYSYPYYNLLTAALTPSTGSANLKSFNINKNRDVSFIVAFNNFAELMNFFRFAESEKFLNSFEKISLKSFSTIGGSSNKTDSYELNFIGRFVPIKSGLD